MADAGFNFRATAGYVTDETNESPVLGELYPNVYGNGYTAGWSGAVSTFDSSSNNDRRIAGFNYVAGTPYFQIDMPASGTKTVEIGDGLGTSNGDQKFTLNDDGSYTVTVTTMAGGRGRGR